MSRPEANIRRSPTPSEMFKRSSMHNEYDIGQLDAALKLDSISSEEGQFSALPVAGKDRVQSGRRDMDTPKRKKRKGFKKANSN